MAPVWPGLAHSLFMEFLLLLFLLVILALPTILMSRRQRAKMAEIQKLQDALQPGDRVVTTAGLHAIVVAVSKELVDLEIAPGLVTSWEKMAVVRVVQPAGGIAMDNQNPGATPVHPADGVQEHPENFRSNDEDDRPSGHPENR